MSSKLKRKKLIIVIIIIIIIMMMIKIKQNKIRKNKEKCTNSFAEK